MSSDLSTSAGKDQRAPEPSVRREAFGLAAGLHDLGNLLQVSLAASQEVDDPWADPDALRQSLALCRSATIRAVELLGRLGDQVAGQERAPGPPLPIDPSATLEDVIQLVRTIAPPEVRVRHDGDGPRVACSIDAQLLHRAVLNLMRNALDAIGPKGTVSLFQQADADARALRIEVVDDGPGMDPATLERARERGFSTRGAGRGLGLAFVDSFAASVGGTLTIESGEGIGTRVSLRVPAHPIAD